MFAKKKKTDTKTEEEQLQEPTEIQEVKLLMEDKAKLLEFVTKEFQETYAGIFNTEELKDMDADAMSLNLLFGMYSELRLIRKFMLKSTNPK
jgi:hypothetical protein